MTEFLQLGTPVWTEGHFGRRAAENDLGMESVGAALLRRLLPGILETTPQAGYYAYYTYLVAKWAEGGGTIERTAFKPFFRRHELGYAIACRLHTHREGFAGGIQGSRGAARAIEGDDDPIRLTERAETYMDEPFGGYGLFYQRVLQDLRLTKPGQRGLVDLPTERGLTLARAFGAVFEGTRYYREFFAADEVPRDVLAELGDATCLCAIPRGAYHDALLDVFFGPPEPEPGWEASRLLRVRSLGLHLAYHGRRPTPELSLSDFRATIAGRAFEDGSPLDFAHAETISAWRAYQFRECQTLVFTAIWSWYLQRLLEEVHPVSHPELRDLLVGEAKWGDVQLESKQLLSEAREVAHALVPDGRALVRWVTPLEGRPEDELGGWLARALVALLAIDHECSEADAVVQDLRDDGGAHRWSLARLHEWLDARAQLSLAAVAGELVDELRNQHVSVATAKLTETDHRDPFCIAEDNGLLRVIRADEPFWTTARFGVALTLLWSLGLLDGPVGDYGLSELGRRYLREIESA